MKPKNPTIARSLLFSGLVTLLILALLEGAARLAGLLPTYRYPLDPVLGWRMVPPSDAYTDAGPAAEVVMLGDSIAYLDARDPASFTQILTRAGRRVINLSGVGYGTDQQWLLLKEFQPQLPRVKDVILHFCPFNDFLDNASPVNPLHDVLRKPYFRLVEGRLELVALDTGRTRRFDQALRTHYATYYLVREALQRTRLLRQVPLGLAATRWDMGPKDRLNPAEWAAYEARVQKGYAITAEILRGLAETVTGEMGARFLMIVHPTAYVPPELPLQQTPPELRNFYQQLGFKVYDMGCDDGKHGLTYAQAAADLVGHRSKAGHQGIARMLAAYLASGKLDPDCLY